MILANSIVDVIENAPPHGHGLGKFRVTVYGKEPNDYVRIYDLAAKSDDAAAREGLDRFVYEINELLIRKAKDEADTKRAE